MKVLILVSGLPPRHLGGAEVAALTLAEYARSMGHDIHLAAIGNGPEQINDVPVHWAGVTETRYLRALSGVPGMVRAANSFNPDLIHAQSFYMAPGALAIHLFTGVPYLLYERGGVYIDSIFNKPLYQGAMSLAHRVVAQTEDQKAALLKHCRRPIEVIPNGIDTTRFQPNPIQRARMRQFLNIPQDAKVALSVGRCRPEKNLMDFVEAAQHLPNVKFILVGDGPQLEELRRASNGIVLFTGAVDNSLIPAYMIAADVLVNTSLTEGFPMSILEGMACGLPIVAPRTCGIPEIVTDHENGILTTPKTREDEKWTSWMSTMIAVDLILSTPNLYQRMAEANRKKAKQYSWENVVRRLYK